jgi:hypothetical protein
MTTLAELLFIISVLVFLITLFIIIPKTMLLSRKERGILKGGNSKSFLFSKKNPEKNTLPKEQKKRVEKSIVII